MIDLHDIRYLRIGTPNLENAIDYCTRIVGLQLVAREGKAAYFRSDKVAVRGDTRDHTLVYFEGDPKDHSIGFDLRHPDDFDTVAGELDKAGFAVREGTAEEALARRVKRVMFTKDPTGKFGGRLTGGVGNFGSYNSALHLDLPEYKHISVKLDGVIEHQDATVKNPLALQVQHNGTRIEALVMSPRMAELHQLMPYKAPPDMSRFVLSPMPGLLVDVSVQPGQKVQAGERVAVIEAMKMENALFAAQDGVVKRVVASKGESLAVDQVIVEFE